MSPLALSLHFLQAQPDRRLVELARQGHEPAFEALVHRYRKELLAYCRRLQPRSGGAEDALQQALLQAWKALKAGAEVRDVRPWLYRIAHNVTVSQLRVTPAIPQEMSDSSGGPEVHQLVEQRLRARAALAGVAALPALQRDVFVSTMLDGASHDEVATALGLSSGAIRGLIYRARATLRSAAAAFVPSPVIHWAIRRAESQGAGSRAVEAMAGGGGAGVAAIIVKGGAVLSVAGAVAGAGGVILAQKPAHHRSAVETAALSAPRAPGRADGRVAAGAAGPVRDAASARAGVSIRDANDTGRTGSAEGRRPDGPRADRNDHGGSTAGSAGGDGGRSPGGPSGTSSVPTTDGRDGGSTVEVKSTSSDGGSGSTGSGGSSGSSGGSDGGRTSGSSDGSALTTTASGPDGGSTDGGSGTSGGQLTLAQATSDGGSGLSGGGSSSGSDGGGSSGSTGSSGSNDTPVTSGSH